MTLSKQDQESLHAQIQEGNIEARNKVVMSIYYLAKNIAQSIHRTNLHIEYEELESEALMLSIKAVDLWDINKSCITTFATIYIKSHLINFINSSCNHRVTTLTTPIYLAKMVKSVKKLNTTNVALIKEKTGLKVKVINHILGVIAASQSIVREFDIQEREHTTSGACIADLISIAEEKLSGIEKSVFIDYITSTNSNKTQLRYKIADKYGMSYTQTVQAIKNAKKSLRLLTRKKSKV